VLWHLAAWTSVIIKIKFGYKFVLQFAIKRQLVLEVFNIYNDFQILSVTFKWSIAAISTVIRMFHSTLCEFSGCIVHNSMLLICIGAYCDLGALFLCRVQITRSCRASTDGFRMLVGF